MLNATLEKVLVGEDLNTEDKRNLLEAIKTGNTGGQITYKGLIFRPEVTFTEVVTTILNALATVSSSPKITMIKAMRELVVPEQNGLKYMKDWVEANFNFNADRVPTLPTVPQGRW